MKPRNKPRNPMVPALQQRNGAGPHQKSNKARRLAARRQLQRKLGDEGGFAQHAGRVC
ncbi:hypothetical protein [Candidatus Dactylopiibacterium carminicum]|uniref:hypothetical protein n=1 Tax=Candidatus Dactylopiibacterium carminicum TaxID=857335 RepID=UPI001482BB86|nr:hypothetical protein [Candidatus Dactylopiibacterium carminicum]